MWRAYVWVGAVCFLDSLCLALAKGERNTGGWKFADFAAVENCSNYVVSGFAFFISTLHFPLAAYNWKEETALVSAT